MPLYSVVFELNSHDAVFSPVSLPASFSALSPQQDSKCSFFLLTVLVRWISLHRFRDYMNHQSRTVTPEFLFSHLQTVISMVETLKQTESPETDTYFFFFFFFAQPHYSDSKPQISINVLHRFRRSGTCCSHQSARA